MLVPVFQLVCALCQTAAPGAPAALVLNAASLQLHGEAGAEARTTSPSIRPSKPPAPVVPSIVADFELGKTRELSINLTPSPSRCAPLFELIF